MERYIQNREFHPFETGIEIEIYWKFIERIIGELLTLILRAVSRIYFDGLSSVHQKLLEKILENF